MWNEPTQAQLDAIPRQYETEGIALTDKPIYLHFFIGQCNWYIAEFDGDDTFFGFAILNDDYEMAEWGYISFSELKELRVSWVHVDHDTYWHVRRACDVEDIVRGMR